jgi:hypothetical protein
VLSFAVAIDLRQKTSEYACNGPVYDFCQCICMALWCVYVCSDVMHMVHSLDDVLGHVTRYLELASEVGFVRTVGIGCRAMCLGMCVPRSDCMCMARLFSIVVT